MEINFDNAAMKESRHALNELEKYLKDRQLTDYPNISNDKQRMGDRKLLDNVPRNERLKHIKGSPLGLTLEVRVY
jgi:hypothetical protein